MCADMYTCVVCTCVYMCVQVYTGVYECVQSSGAHAQSQRTANVGGVGQEEGGRRWREKTGGRKGQWGQEGEARQDVEVKKEGWGKRRE